MQRVETGQAVSQKQREALIKEKAHFIRTETVRLISIAKTGHYSSTFSVAEIIATLYYGVMRIRKGDPTWIDRDRFLLGKGHAAVGLFPVLADHDFFDPAVLDGYTRVGSPLGDHPDMTRVPGVDFSSGSLGHNLSTALGMAIAGQRTGRDFMVFALLGDGEMHEGQIWEAANVAGHNRMRNLVAIVDRNGYCLDGRVEEVISIEPLADRWRAFGWHVEEVDGHDVSALLEVLDRLRHDTDRDKPAVVIANTIKGKGVEFMERNFGWHLGWLNEADEQAVLAELEGGR